MQSENTTLIKSILTSRMALDTYGFVKLYEDEDKEQRRHKGGKDNKTSKLLNTRLHFGRTRCKDLCRFLPHTENGIRRGLQDNGHTFWCSICLCIMKCNRCRCCGMKGRSSWRKTRILREAAKRI